MNNYIFEADLNYDDRIDIQVILNDGAVQASAYGPQEVMFL